jgi:hypothetical protein
VGGKGGGGGSGEKWTNPCMHIWIIKEKWKKIYKNTHKKNHRTEMVHGYRGAVGITCNAL